MPENSFQIGSERTSGRRRTAKRTTGTRMSARTPQAAHAFQCAFNFAAQEGDARLAPPPRRFFLLGIEWQSERGHDSLEIVSPVKFDLDPAAFLTVMNHDVGREMLLQTILEIAQAG